jgi:hypothetical protein
VQLFYTKLYHIPSHLCWSTYLIVFFQLIFHFFTFLSRMIPLFSFVILPRRNKAITRSVLHLNGGQITRVFLELPKQKKSYLTFWSFNNDILQFASKYTSCYLVVHSWFNCECFASSKMLEQIFVHEANLTPPFVLDVPVPSQDSERSCISIYGYHFYLFLRFFIGIWKCSESVVFFVFHCIASFWLVSCKQENAFQVPSSHRFLGWLCFVYHLRHIFM